MRRWLWGLDLRRFIPEVELNRPLARASWLPHKHTMNHRRLTKGHGQMINESLLRIITLIWILSLFWRALKMCYLETGFTFPHDLAAETDCTHTEAKKKKSPANTCLKMCRWWVRRRRRKGHPNEREEGKSWAARGIRLCTLNTYTHLYKYYDDLALAPSPTNKIVLICLQREKQRAAQGGQQQTWWSCCDANLQPKTQNVKNKEVGVANETSAGAHCEILSF